MSSLVREYATEALQAYNARLSEQPIRREAGTASISGRDHRRQLFAPAL